MEPKNIQNLAEDFIKTRSESSFKALYERLKPGLTTYAYNILKNEQASDDVVSDAFIKMWSKIEQYNNNWNFSTWVYRIVRNEAMQWLRKNANTYSIESIGGEQMADKIMMADLLIVDNGVGGQNDQPNWFFDEEPDQRITLHEKVLEQIKSLPQLYKDIMIDRELNQMKYEEISEKYGLELNTVKTRISRARQKICKFSTGSDRKRKKKDKEEKSAIK